MYYKGKCKHLAIVKKKRFFILIKRRVPSVQLAQWDVLVCGLLNGNNPNGVRG